MAKSFEELENKLSPKAQMLAKEKADALLTKIRLAEIREARQLTQEELASKLNVKQSSISKMENRTGISLNNLQRMVQAMGGKLEITLKFPDQNYNLLEDA